jgi:hypothetical protein
MRLLRWYRGLSRLERSLYWAQFEALALALLLLWQAFCTSRLTHSYVELVDRLRADLSHCADSIPGEEMP